MKSLHLALSLTAFVLAACGSSGNGSFTSSKLLPNNHKPSVSSTTAPSNNANSNSAAAPSHNSNNSSTAAPSHNTNSSSTAAPSNNANSNNTAANGSSGHTGLKPLGNHVITVAQTPYESVENKGYTPLSEQKVPRILSINGVKIDLKYTEHIDNLVDPDDFNNKQKNFGRILSFNNVKIAWVQGHPDLPENIGYGWVQGEESKRVPPRGKYNYEGVAYVHRGLEPVDLIDQNNISSMGNLNPVHFNVDFAAKKMDGYIDVMRANTRYKLAADIQGTRFAGVKDGTTVQGAFYGQDGAEMAGSLINTSDKNNPMYGVFAGTKETKIAD